MKIVKVLPKGQIVIPKALRENIGISIGRSVIVERVNNSILIIPEPEKPLEVMRGLLKKQAETSATKTIRKLRKEWKV